MTSEYESIFSRFLQRVEDYKLAGLDEELANEMLIGYLRNGASESYVRRLFDTFVMDDDIEEIEWTLKTPVDELADYDFVEDILTDSMVIKWIEPKYFSVLNTSQYFTNSEAKFYSQANHMGELENMLNNMRVRIRKKIRDRGYFYVQEQ